MKTLMLFVFIFLVLIGTGSLVGEEHLEQGDYNLEEFTIKTESGLYWNSSKYSPQITEIVNDGTGFNFSDVHNKRVKKVINKGIDFLGFTTFEFAKFGIEYGYANPDLNGEKLVNWAKIMTYLIIALFIIPALPYIIGIGVIIFFGLRKVYRLIRGIKK